MDNMHKDNLLLLNNSQNIKIYGISQSNAMKFTLLEKDGAISNKIGR